MNIAQALESFASASRDAALREARAEIERLNAALADPEKELLDAAMRATGMPEEFINNQHVRGEMMAALRAVGRFLAARAPESKP